MTDYQRLIVEFGQNPETVAALLAVVGGLFASGIGVLFGNHRGGYQAGKVIFELLGAAGVAALFGASIATSPNMVAVAIGVGFTWSALYQALRVGITRLILIKFAQSSGGLVE